MAGEAAAPKRKRPPRARKPAVVVPREVLAEGICRYVVRQGSDTPQDEGPVPLPERGFDAAAPRAVTPVMSYREYLPDHRRARPRTSGWWTIRRSPAST